MSRASRTFRVFVSSTFSDLKEERNALQPYVFPRLRDLCARHLTRFQAIDLRWGVSDEAGLDQQAMNICLEEIRRCRIVTPRPNFIVLLGDRYGWHPLPPQIPAHEFEQILAKVDSEERDLLLGSDDRSAGDKGWYRRDDNAVPPAYILQPRTGPYQDNDTWTDVERRLHASLARAVQDMPLEAKDRLKYEASATEQEMVEGALRVEGPETHVGGFFRSLRVKQPDGTFLPIHQAPSDPATRRRMKDVVDLDKQDDLDTGARARLEALRTRFHDFLPGNVQEYDAEWRGSGISTDHIGSLPGDLDECLKLNERADPPHTMCVDVWRWLARIILEEAGRQEREDPLEREITDHEDFATDRARVFVGRAEILESIDRYVSGSDSHPLVVFGPSGSGKSALLAKALERVRARHPEARVVGRFIGATPGSSVGRSLLASLGRQLAHEYQADESTVPAAYNDLIQDFPKRLALATPEETPRPVPRRPRPALRRRQRAESRLAPARPPRARSPGHLDSGPRGRGGGLPARAPHQPSQRGVCAAPPPRAERGRAPARPLAGGGESDVAADPAD
jgi:Domain of unknown function (DUF4062)